MSRPIVIGGGFAGLAAGVDLAAHGVRPLVLEARPQLGGRAYSFRHGPTGEVIDNGQHALMGCYTHTLAFLERIGATRKLVRQPNLRVAMTHRRLGPGVIAAAPLPGPLHMLAGVLRYRLLTRSERVAVLLGGLRVLAMHRRRDARLAKGTVAEVLTSLGQSAHAQASFWNPVAIATLNESPARAAAAPFAAVLARAFFGSRRDAQFILPAVGLSELYTGDARRYIEARGGSLLTRAAVAGIDVDRAESPSGAATWGRVRGVRLRDGTAIAASSCIVAVPPRAALGLLPDGVRPAVGLDRPDRFGASPIVSVHLWLERPVLAEPFLGLLGATTQWLFNRTALLGRNGGGQCLSAVISAGREVAQWDHAEIVRTVVADLHGAVPGASGVAVRHAAVVKEKHATISTTPAVEPLRPRAETPIAGLFLAGDWIATGLPPTIESAVQSGHEAAGLVMKNVWTG